MISLLPFLLLSWLLRFVDIIDLIFVQVITDVDDDAAILINEFQVDSIIIDVSILYKMYFDCLNGNCEFHLYWLKKSELIILIFEYARI